MNTQKAKERLAQSMDVVWTQGDLDKISEYYTDDLVEHNPYGEIEGLDAYRHFVSLIRETYSDFRVTPLNMVADESFIACTFTVEGKHTKEVGDLKPTNKHVKVQGTYLGRLENGKIAEAWNNFDLASLLSQLGTMPQPSFVQTREQQVREE